MNAWMRITRENPIQLVPVRENTLAFADLREGFLRLIVIEGRYEPDFFRIGDYFLRDGGHFFDVGANHGLLSFGLAAHASQPVQFHMFEPNPNLCDTLAKSVELHPGSQFHINQVAVSDQAGFVEMQFNELHTGESHVVDGGGVRIPCITLSDYIRDKSLDKITLMKIDVEGYEQFALKGVEPQLVNQQIGAVYFEYCHAWLARHHEPSALLDYFRSVGYQVFYCKEYDLDTFDGPPYMLCRNNTSSKLPLKLVTPSERPPSTDLIAIPEGVAEPCN